jgi:OmcA/MtrC family decaheme c-type cytochrome
VITFTAKNKQGDPIVLSGMTNTRVYMAGPTTDIPSYIREDALRAESLGDGRYSYTFTASLPADTGGSWQFGIEGYRNVTLLAGTTKARTVRDIGPNQVVTVTADGSAPQPRRLNVSNEKCNKCHYTLSFHGGNRNAVEMCTFCHNPNLTEGDKKVSWNFVNMIHRIHGEEISYPGVISNCTGCHINDSQSLPIAPGLNMVANGEALTSPTPPTTNACLSCHNEPSAWQHARANTTELGESCAVCHGRTAEFGVNKVHAQ